MPMNQRSMPESATLLDELQESLSHESLSRRVDTLRRVTDLFLGRCVDYSDDLIDVFDDVFGCLIRQMESSALVLLSQRLAPIPSAPLQTMRTLAFNDLIDIASPALAQSDRLDDDMLIEAARCKSQQHLLAISTRRNISTDVTDILVVRGNDIVVQSTVQNPGAEFSEHGFAVLVDRAEHSDEITTCVALRPDIPRHHYLKLIARASDAVRRSLEIAHPNAGEHISFAVSEVTRRARSTQQAIPLETDVSHALIRSLYEEGRLNETQIVDFADSDKFDEVNAAIACLAQVSVDLAENIMIEARVEGIFILAKVCGFSWTTVQSIIAMRAKLSDLVPTETAAHRDAYARLRQSTAQQALRFHRMQQSTALA